MRIWSLHPKYLDAKGLVALWREGLLAKHVLEDKTKGYRHHPQLIRFRQSSSPVAAINEYLRAVFDVASARGYRFDRTKIDWESRSARLTVTTGQLTYEAKHLSEKLKNRDDAKYREHTMQTHFDAHPLFDIIEGIIEPWEITTGAK